MSQTTPKLFESAPKIWNQRGTRFHRPLKNPELFRQLGGDYAEYVKALKRKRKYGRTERVKPVSERFKKSRYRGRGFLYPEVLEAFGGDLVLYRRFLDKVNYEDNLEIRKAQDKARRERVRNDPLLHQKQLEASYRFNRKCKIEAIEHYSSGTNRCVCCGVDGLKFLTIDHINNDGYKDKRPNGRRTSGLIQKLRAWGWPTGFQVLCWNCNMGKYFNGEICPHKGEEKP